MKPFLPLSKSGPSGHGCPQHPVTDGSLVSGIEVTMVITVLLLSLKLFCFFVLFFKMVFLEESHCQLKL